MSGTTASILFFGTIVVVKGLLTKQEANQSNASNKQNHQHKSLALPSPEETLSLLKNRRSIFTKQFTGEPVPREIINDMLEASQWAPNHHLTEPWRFCVYESEGGRESVGLLLQKLYKSSCTPEDDHGTSSNKSKLFSQAKFDKKLKGAMLSSHIIAICVKTNNKYPIVEDICSVAMAVQNMYLMATVHGVGSYWSSGGVQAADDGSFSNVPVANPKELSEFLGFEDGEAMICLGWLYVGSYYGPSNGKKKIWPSGRRRGMEDKVVWR